MARAGFDFKTLLSADLLPDERMTQEDFQKLMDGGLSFAIIEQLLEADVPLALIKKGMVWLLENMLKELYDVSLITPFQSLAAEECDSTKALELSSKDTELSSKEIKRLSDLGFPVDQLKEDSFGAVLVELVTRMKKAGLFIQMTDSAAQSGGELSPEDWHRLLDKGMSPEQIRQLLDAGVPVQFLKKVKLSVLQNVLKQLPPPKMPSEPPFTALDMQRLMEEGLTLLQIDDLLDEGIPVEYLKRGSQCVIKNVLKQLSVGTLPLMKPDEVQPLPELQQSEARQRLLSKFHSNFGPQEPFTLTDLESLNNSLGLTPGESLELISMGIPLSALKECQLGDVLVDLVEELVAVGCLFKLTPRMENLGDELTDEDRQRLEQEGLTSGQIQDLLDAGLPVQYLKRGIKFLLENVLKQFSDGKPPPIDLAEALLQKSAAKQELKSKLRAKYGPPEPFTISDIESVNIQDLTPGNVLQLINLGIALKSLKEGKLGDVLVDLVGELSAAGCQYKLFPSMALMGSELTDEDKQRLIQDGLTPRQIRDLLDAGLLVQYLKKGMKFVLEYVLKQMSRGALIHTEQGQPLTESQKSEARQQLQSKFYSKFGPQEPFTISDIKHLNALGLTPGEAVQLINMGIPVKALKEGKLGDALVDLVGELTAAGFVFKVPKSMALLDSELTSEERHRLIKEGLTHRQIRDLLDAGMPVQYLKKGMKFVRESVLKHLSEEKLPPIELDEVFPQKSEAGRRLLSKFCSKFGQPEPFTISDIVSFGLPPGHVLHLLNMGIPLRALKEGKLGDVLVDLVGELAAAGCVLKVTPSLAQLGFELTDEDRERLVQEGLTYESIQDLLDAGLPVPYLKNGVRWLVDNVRKQSVEFEAKSPLMVSSKVALAEQEEAFLELEEEGYPPSLVVELLAAKFPIDFLRKRTLVYVLKQTVGLWFETGISLDVLHQRRVSDKDGRVENTFMVIERQALPHEEMTLQELQILRQSSPQQSDATLTDEDRRKLAAQGLKKIDVQKLLHAGLSVEVLKLCNVSAVLLEVVRDLTHAGVNYHTLLKLQNKNDRQQILRELGLSAYVTVRDQMYKEEERAKRLALAGLVQEVQPTPSQVRSARKDRSPVASARKERPFVVSDTEEGFLPAVLKRTRVKKPQDTLRAKVQQNTLIIGRQLYAPEEWQVAEDNRRQIAPASEQMRQQVILGKGSEAAFKAGLQEMPESHIALRESKTVVTFQQFQGIPQSAVIKLTRKRSQRHLEELQAKPKQQPAHIKASVPEHRRSFYEDDDVGDEDDEDEEDKTFLTSFPTAIPSTSPTPVLERAPLKPTAVLLRFPGRKRKRGFVRSRLDLTCVVPWMQAIPFRLMDRGHLSIERTLASLRQLEEGASDMGAVAVAPRSFIRARAKEEASVAPFSQRERLMQGLRDLQKKAAADAKASELLLEKIARAKSGRVLTRVPAIPHYYYSKSDLNVQGLQKIPPHVPTWYKVQPQAIKKEKKQQLSQSYSSGAISKVPAHSFFQRETSASQQIAKYIKFPSAKGDKHKRVKTKSSCVSPGIFHGRPLKMDKSENELVLSTLQEGKEETFSVPSTSQEEKEEKLPLSTPQGGKKEGLEVAKWTKPSKPLAKKAVKATKPRIGGLDVQAKTSHSFHLWELKLPILRLCLRYLTEDCGILDKPMWVIRRRRIGGRHYPGDLIQHSSFDFKKKSGEGGFQNVFLTDVPSLGLLPPIRHSSRHSPRKFHASVWMYKVRGEEKQRKALLHGIRFQPHKKADVRREISSAFLLALDGESNWSFFFNNTH
jgi:hypothetical protein